MEERYEIRGKIGQGGLGAVYRGYDTRMSREVAIKRISVTNDDPAMQEESTRQLIKEAGALASLQHPHIVTVYDVGSDDDGPYVVMELISGKTLDELIERAPLTWPDFRELAVQTQEALIAAQELGLIHGDIKPANLMLTWLPSGKFQMKIVDFGLATLTQAQSLEDLQEIEAVFGSIFFMAPEQFERIPLDARTDIYAMGCVYYQALTGKYPFSGETGHEVMVAHLHHQVIPIQEVRADIPVWACDWIMWMLNRMPADRPESAREALQVFFQNDKNPKPTMSLGKAPPIIPAGPRARLPIPGGGSTQPASPTKRLVIDPRMAPPGYVPPVVEPEPVVPEPVAEPQPAPQVITAPQPLLPPEGSKPSIYTAPIEIPDHLPPTPTATGHFAPARTYATPLVKPSSGKGSRIVLVVASIVILGLLGLLLVNRIKASKESQRLGNMLIQAGTDGTSEVPMTGPDLAHFLEVTANADTDEKQQEVFKLLAIAKPSDGSDLDAAITQFTTTSTQLLPEVRATMIQEVLEKRMNKAMVPALVDFARSTKDVNSAIVALRAVRNSAGDEQFEPFFSLVQGHPNPEIRKAAEEAITEILKKSDKRRELMKLINTALNSITDSRIRESLLRLKAPAGG
ncbi:protein kinase [bacterium]|nr:protein kinase [bacterium]